MTHQHQRAEAFRALHQGAGLLVLPNPWDAGSAKMLAHLGFDALATTSAGLAFALGRRDAEGAVSRTEALANARQIVEPPPICRSPPTWKTATAMRLTTAPRPSAWPPPAAWSVAPSRMPAAAPDNPSMSSPLELAVERITAAVQAARALPFPFTLGARAENFLHGRADLDDTLRRLVAFADAGADVLYAPGLNRPARKSSRWSAPWHRDRSTCWWARPPCKLAWRSWQRWG